MNVSANASNATRTGVICAIAAYTMWGIAPLYFKELAMLPAAEILVHRVIWSVILVFGLIVATKQIPALVSVMRNKKIMGILFIAGVLLAANWLLYIWAVNNDKILDASLGYYINPMVNVFLGRVFLGEKLRPLQRVAVLLAIVGVTILIVSYGQLPWIALVLACTFGTYGLLRKRVPVDSLTGLFVETLLLSPFAIVYWVMFGTEYSNLATNDLSFNILLIASGVITTAPLLCFTAAAKRIMYSTLGFFQYIGPTLMFILAVTLYGEPLEEDRLVTFGFVWAGLVLFSLDSLRAYRVQKQAKA
ncbi:EamA family transporter RarD [Alteromonas sp. KUL49]|uniref:EamA family transporter RarD n=2 Tax=Alteromonas sp. KUL49 TaxID=2480798 RepID=UPI00102EECA5|nr:EamA family transporter RarD [Alteromonas sp. KUL49]TAP39320.1 EamA family transporter RarD [Alteromonas sp. KUL49]GEA12113.1 chloramphenicol resistance permease RarD [Alteromonas sp. KUL49]